MILISTDGVEPSTLKGTDFKSAAYTNSAKQIIKKKRARVDSNHQPFECKSKILPIEISALF